jgi:hypothetical protein
MMMENKEEIDQPQWWLQGIELSTRKIWTEQLTLALVGLFFLCLYQIITRHPEMFLKRLGRRHALTGLIYLMWITLGFVDLAKSIFLVSFLPLYFIILGTLGVCLTLLAAFEFQHKGVKNFASGTLDQHATVTYNEMIEHAYYQGLNLLQIVYLYACPSFVGNHIWSMACRLLLLYIVTLPWYFRDAFPVHKFSDNYKYIDMQSTALIRTLYRVKKYQYIFYKHFVLRGLNISICLRPSSLPAQWAFRLFWLLLNTSYVMEFFLQTLVKKRYLAQQHMLVLQHLLMLAASLSALTTLSYVSAVVALSSMVLNFVHRKHDLINTVGLAGTAAVLILATSLQ